MALPVLTRVTLTWPVPTRAWSAEVIPTVAELMIARATTVGATSAAATTVGPTRVEPTRVEPTSVAPTDISATSNVSTRAARVGPHPSGCPPTDPVTTGAAAGELGQERPEMLLDDWRIR